MLRPALLLSLTLTACSPTPQMAPVPSATVTQEEEHLPEAAAVQFSPDQPVRSASYLKTTRVGIPMELVIYDSRILRAVVADQPAGPGSKWADARSAGRAYGGVAAINAGFFTPEGEPLGVVITDGQSRGNLNRASSLGSGFYLIDSAGRAALRRRGSSTAQAAELLQSGPFLIEKGQAVAGLSDKSSSARSFIATDGRYGWLIGRTGPCSLRDLANALKGANLNGIEIQTALNLDGGRSSDLWVSEKVSGGPTNTRPMWNKPVRNFLVLKPLR